MTVPDHYSTLGIGPDATAAQIKQAYRTLAKQLHPDSGEASASHERFVRLNAAYEVLGDAHRRQHYDRERGHRRGDRQAAAAQATQARRASTAANGSDDLDLWIQQIYQPVDRCLSRVISPFRKQLNALAADPYDDALMADFCRYLAESRQQLLKGERQFRSARNPASAARVAASLYYCLNQLGDALSELERFTQCYDDAALGDGREMIRIASRMRRELKEQVAAIAR